MSQDLSQEDVQRIARSEAEAVYEELGVEDPDGRQWTLTRLCERFEVSRRTALEALGLIALGYTAPIAILKSTSGTAQAQAATDNLTVPGTVDASAVTTDEINNVAYAKQFTGSDLATRINNGFGAGYSVIRVAPQSSAYDWLAKVIVDDGEALIFDKWRQDIGFSGSSGTGTGAGDGSSDIALEIDQNARVWGGRFESTRDDDGSWDTSNPWTCINFVNGCNDATVWINEARSFEKGLVMHETGGGTILMNDVLMDRAFDCWRSMELEGTNSGSTVNENTLRVRRIVINSDVSDGTEIGINLIGFAGNNKFLPSAIENGGGQAGTGVQLEDASLNQFFGCRVEGWTTLINSTSDTPRQNYFWGLNGYPSPSKISLNNEGDAIIRGAGNRSVTLADDAKAVLHADSQQSEPIRGWVRNSQDAAAALFTAINSSVTLEQTVGNWATSDTDTDHCIFRDGNVDLVLKNRRGGQRFYTYRVRPLFAW